MYLLAIDTETTGLDVTNDDIIELGYAIYHVNNPAPILMKDFFLTPKLAITAEVTSITGITEDIINKAAVTPNVGFDALLSDIKEYDIKWLVGHNIVDYDHPILKHNLQRCGLELPQINMIDTKTDVKYTVPSKSNRLSYLAADHGFINPFPHRALTDAMTCMVLLYKYDIKKVLEVASTPMIEIRADVNFDKRDLAKQLGYNWDGDRKIWTKRIRKFYLQEEVQAARFPVILLEKRQGA